MSKHPSCLSCGTLLTNSAAEGLCPACLLMSALGDFAAEALPPLEVVRAGTRFGDYEVINVLGRGGMGIVYLARQVSLNRKVALKMVRSPHMASETDLARFQQEAEAAGRLDHPHIMPVYEIGEQNGMCYFTMKLVEDARSLASEVARGPMEPQSAARLIVKVARAIHYAHQRGVIHRDVKPGNILLDVAGEPTLADFGLAKLLEAEVSLTVSNRVMGTPQYMSPEQVSHSGSEVTTATDIYSLGAVLYEMLTGRPPFQSDSVHELLRLVVEQEPKPLRTLQPGIDRELQTICLKCIEKDPRRRYASANDLAEDLENWLALRPIKARPVSAAGRLRKWTQRRPGIAILTSALVLTALVMVGSVIYAWRLSEDARRTADENRRRSDDMLNQALEGFASKAAALRFNKDKPGHRWEALDAIAQAVAIRPMESLRNELIACLSLADMRPAKGSWPITLSEQPCRGAISPDFTLHAQSDTEGRILIRSLPEFRELSRLPGIGGRVQSVLRFSHDGKYLAASTGSEESAVSKLAIWEVKTSKLIVSAQPVCTDACDFMPDGSNVFIGVKTELVLLEVTSGKVLRRMPLASEPHTVRCSPDGRFVAISHLHGGIEVFEVDGTNPSRIFNASDSARGIAWHPKGHILAIPTDDGRIVIWDVLREPWSARSWLALSGSVLSLTWHPNGRHLFSVGSDGRLTMWESRAMKSEIGMQARAMGDLIVSPDGRKLGPFFEGDKLQMLELNDGAVVHYGEGHPGSFINSAAWNWHGSVLATAGEDSVKFWNWDGEEVGSLPVKGSRSVLWTADSLIVSGTEGLTSWRLKEAKDKSASALHFELPHKLDARTGWEWAALNADGRWLAAAHSSNIELFDLSSAHPPRTFSGQPKASYVSISPDGNWLAAGTWHGNDVRVWSLPQGEPRDLKVRGSANVGFNLDGKLLISGSADEYAFWRISDWERVHSVPTRLGDFYGAMAFSPRGTVVALESEHNRALVIHAPNFIEIASPDFDHQRPLTFSRRGVLMVDADAGQRLVFWDLFILRNALKSFNLDWDYIPKMENEVVTPIESVEFTP